MECLILFCADPFGYSVPMVDLRLFQGLLRLTHDWWTLEGERLLFQMLGCTGTRFIFSKLREGVLVIRKKLQNLRCGVRGTLSGVCARALRKLYGDMKMVQIDVYTCKMKEMIHQRQLSVPVERTYVMYSIQRNRLDNLRLLRPDPTHLHPSYTIVWHHHNQSRSFLSSTPCMGGLHELILGIHCTTVHRIEGSCPAFATS